MISETTGEGCGDAGEERRTLYEALQCTFVGPEAMQTESVMVAIIEAVIASDTPLSDEQVQAIIEANK